MSNAQPQKSIPKYVSFDNDLDERAPDAEMKANFSFKGAGLD
jgi:hypothetical protein